MIKLPADYNKLTWQERRDVRNEYVRIQEGLCAHCQAPLSGAPTKKVAALPVNEKLFPENFFKNPVHLHHSHETGLTIGAVHCYCNAVLWEYYGE